jgi:DNA repair photolyase
MKTEYTTNPTTPNAALEVASGCARTSMNGKPVLHRNAKTVLQMNAEAFEEKLLCDGLILNPGDSCAYSCAFCYVGSLPLKFLVRRVLKEHEEKTGEFLEHSDAVIRRTSPADVLLGQLLSSSGRRKFPDDRDNRVVFSSSTVDVAANMELLRETAGLLNLILEHTAWQVRLLSKSHLLHKLVADGMIPERYHPRLIFGFSTGTMDDRVARAFEHGTALVSKRIESLHWLQDRGFRTYGMICPSLPQQDYRRFSEEACEAIRVDRCEHVWAEPINVRGKSLVKTLAALKAAGLDEEAGRLAAVSGKGHGNAWEDYARQTFLAHVQNIPAEKLRFLQYIDEKTADWWSAQRRHGAILLGTTAKALGLTAV